MNKINKNPLRIAGILSNSSSRDIERQRTKTKAFLKVGKEVVSDYDFPFLNKISRTEEAINSSFASFNQIMIK